MFEIVEIPIMFGALYGAKKNFTIQSKIKVLTNVALVIDPVKAKDIAVLMQTYSISLIGRWSLLLNDETDEVLLDSNILTYEDVGKGFTWDKISFPFFQKITPNLTHTIITKLDDVLIDAILLEKSLGSATNFNLIKNLSATLYLTGE